jgi:hypothetical protein
MNEIVNLHTYTPKLRCLPISCSRRVKLKAPNMILALDIILVESYFYI